MQTQAKNIIGNVTSKKGTDIGIQESQFNYEANQVMQGEKRSNNASDASEMVSLSTAPGFSHKLMGSNALREKPNQELKALNQAQKDALKKKQEKKDARKKVNEIMHSTKGLRSKKLKYLKGKGQNILQVDIDSNIIYKPKTEENRKLFEQIITIISKLIQGISSEELRSFTDEILASLKQDNKTDKEKFQEVRKLLENLTESTFDKLYALSRQITDYCLEADSGRPEQTIGEKQANLDMQDSSNENSDAEENNRVEDGYIMTDSEEEEDEENSQDFQGVGAKEDIVFEEEENIEYFIDINDIDAYWLQTQLNQALDDAIQSKNLEPQIMQILKGKDSRTCEAELVEVLSYDHFKLIQKLTKNRFKIYFMTLIQKCKNDEEKLAVKTEMESSEEGQKVLQQLSGQDKDNVKSQMKKIEIQKQLKSLKKKEVEEEQERITKLLLAQDLQDSEFSKISKKYLDLDSLTFQQGNHTMSNPKCSLPPDSFRIQKKGYDEIYVPAVKQKPSNVKIVKKDEIPAWTHPAFDTIDELNLIQSSVYPAAFQTSENMLVCAPTGAGKTNVALLTMLQEIGKWRRSNGKIDKNKFKMVYISPMKALVAEQVSNFQQRLENFGINVRELTGDMNLSKAQIEDTQLIISTPEKWDIVTRKSGDKTYTELVKLLIIDEIHLLHDSRGPVLESLVARTIRQIEQTQSMVRIVGLSATLPNYTDVASFIRVKKSGLFYFDHTFRPVPLEQQYIGVSEKKPVRRHMLMNEILYEKVMERAGKYQMIIFVHSRKDTIKTAQFLKEMAYSKDELHKFVKEESDTKKILTHVSENNINNSELKDILPYGFAAHHAGLTRGDREDVENLFYQKHIQVLISTATLAWGVNLPAHTVIIKGTQIYSPEEGKWKELSPQDILQMMGRAGRPRFDQKGEGIILTSYTEMKFYLSLLNQQLPIESQFIASLPDQLNAEIVLGTITTLKEAVNWLGYTYLYIRMLRNPNLYGITDEEMEEDKLLINRRTNLIHTAADLLDKNKLIKYFKNTGEFQVTSLGKIASHYYIKFSSIAIYNQNLKPNMSMIELFRIFALSSEFKFIPIRDEEKGEVMKLMETVPVPIKGSAEDPTTKINILLQAYIGKLSLEGFAINADMIYITQSAGRIVRAIFEICLKRGWAQATEVALNVCKMVDKKMWLCQTVLRQFKGIPEEILRRIERKEQFTFEHFYNMTSNQIGDLIKLPKLGKVLHKLIHQFPKLEVKPYLQPITRMQLKIDLTISTDFQWENKIHGYSEPFWIFVQDCNGEEILYSEYFVMKEKYISEKDYTFSFTVPLFANLHPLYYIKVISDRWLQSETIMPISFKNLILPERFSAPTELYDLQLLPVSNIEFKEGQKLFNQLGVKQFNQIQTQVFQSFYKNTSDNVFLGAPTGSGKSICMYLSMFATFQEYPNKKVVYVAPKEELCGIFYEEMRKLFSPAPFNKKVGVLSGQLTSDLKIVDKHDIILASAENLDILTRKWKTRKVLKEIKLMIFDEIHLLNENYSVLEVVISRMRIIQSTIGAQSKLQIIGLATSLADYKEISAWLGAGQLNTYNFDPSVRPYPVEIIVYPFDQNDRKSRILSMQKYMYYGIKNMAQTKQTIVFVSDRKQAKLTAIELTTLAAADNTPKRFLRSGKILQKMLEGVQISDPVFLNVLEAGIGLLYEGQSEAEKDFVKICYQQDVIQVIISTYKLSWELTEHAFFTVVLDNQRYDGYEKKYIDYTIPDMLQMIGRSLNLESEVSAKSLILCHSPKTEYYKQFLLKPYPVESHLNHYLNNHLCAEVVAKNITSKHDCIDWITWTFMYWRLTQNPNYYNLLEVSGSAITDYLSELIEATVEELEDMKCIAIEEELELLPVNLGIISSHYYIHTSSIEMYAENIKDDSKMKQLIQILSNATEFEEVPIRQGEDPLLRNLSYEIEYKFDKVNFNEPATKTNILLQAHFSRIQLSPDFRYDQKQVLEKAVKLVHAMVNVISSNCWLDQAIKAMQLNQMIVQSIWANKSTLLQLPYIDDQIVLSLKKQDVNDIEDFMNMDDDVRSKILSHLDEDQVQQIAEAANRYPTVSMNYAIKNDLSEIHAKEIIDLVVEIERDGDEDDYTDYVIAPYYPKQKEELWWLIVGDKKNNKLHAIKSMSFKQKHKVNLKFEIPEEGKHSLTLYLICDSYIACDSMEKFELDVLPALEEDDEDDDDDVEEEN